MSESVELAPEVLVALRAMRDAGEVPLRCNKGPIRTAVAAAVRALNEDDLGPRVRPWDLSALRRRAAARGRIAAAVAVYVDADVLVAVLRPGYDRVVLRGAGDFWRLVRFLDADEATEGVRLTPEITQDVDLDEFSPEAVLTALGVAKPDDVDLDIESEDLGQGETETRYRYLFTDNGRSVLAEEVRNEIFDGATPCTRSLRGVLIDGGHGALVTANGDGAQLIRG
ncbi:hypothetical protein A7U43_19915 [Mycobacterium adipatum]|uniref:Uncharacterized protein n=1 Tax=Mycobacterium adipatum TaxID=1682113 RepID=A0A172UQ85_9MYCO|nr:hypothetical protein [Mycobacterium adipatum]ANE81251.1 hypothetical protein A7U43_19915 [Mycobacterium adipatum]MBI5735415.1 hypothetical protein [Mycolicibacterium neoaurum]